MINFDLNNRTANLAQIFIVFASFLMVEKFGYSLTQITALFLLNAAFNILLAPLVGKVISRIGERAALVFEYIGLIGVFIAYAFVEDGALAAGLYVIDHMFFAFAIAIKTYFQKIGDPADMSSTASLAFTNNHIDAVVHQNTLLGSQSKLQIVYFSAIMNE